jgi:hypothetical protein
MRAHLLGDATRAQVSPGLAALGLLAPRLREHRASPQDPRAGSLSLGGLIELTLMHTGAQLGDHVGRGAELGGDGQRELEGLGHRASGRKKWSGRVARSGRPWRSADRPLTPGQW